MADSIQAFRNQFLDPGCLGLSTCMQRIPVSPARDTHAHPYDFELLQA